MPSCLSSWSPTTCDHTAPRVDKLAIECRHDRGRWKNHRAENSHQPARRREPKTQRFRGRGQPRNFFSCTPPYTNSFNVQRDLILYQERRGLTDLTPFARFDGVILCDLAMRSLGPRMRAAGRLMGRALCSPRSKPAVPANFPAVPPAAAIFCQHVELAMISAGEAAADAASLAKSAVFAAVTSKSSRLDQPVGAPIGRSPRFANGLLSQPAGPLVLH